jgi:hypothetical protein
MANIKENKIKELSKEPRFQKLARYFTSLEYEDFQHLDVEDMLMSVEPYDRPLMKVFCTKYLLPYFEPPKYQHQSTGTPRNNTDKSPKSLPTNGNYRAIVSTSAYDRGGGLTTLKDVIKLNLELVDGTLNLSLNNFLDSDLQYVLQLTEKYQVKLLDLSFNSFHGYNSLTRQGFDAEFLKVLDNVENYVIVYGNPMASVDRMDLFKKFNEKQLSKLIWIPEQWVAAGAWKAMVDKQFHDIVNKTHVDFYKTR